MTFLKNIEAEYFRQERKSFSFSRAYNGYSFQSSIARYLEKVKKRMKIEKPMQIKKTQLKRNRKNYDTSS